MNINKLVDLEKKYGGFTIADSIYKINSSNSSSIVKCCGGDRMASEQMAYGEVYSNVINNLNNINIVLEIGILTGIGLAIWSDIFPNATIYGFDIYINNFLDNKNKLIELGAFKNNNIYINEFDQYNPDINLLDKITSKNKINFVIDDGCHKDKPIITTFNSIYPFLDKNFIYVIEDNYDAYKDLLNNFKDIRATNIEQITVITHKHRNDIHDALKNIKSLNSTKHNVYFTEKNQIVSHSTNNNYGNVLLAKYNVGSIIKLYKDSNTIELKIIKKEVKSDKIILYFNNILTEELLANRRNWIIIT